MGDEDETETVEELARNWCEHWRLAASMHPFVAELLEGQREAGARGHARELEGKAWRTAKNLADARNEVSTLRRALENVRASHDEYKRQRNEARDALCPSCQAEFAQARATLEDQ